MTKKDEKILVAGLAAGALAVVTGAMIFFPNLSRILSSPYVWPAALALFWVFGVLSVLLSAVAIFLASYTNVEAPYEAQGLGLLLGLASILSLIAYSGANAVDDYAAPVIIRDVDYLPNPPSPGDTIKFSAEATDQNNDEIQYLWEINGEVIGDSRTVHWQSSGTPNRYEVVLTADDGDKSHQAIYRFSFNLEKEGECSLSTERVESSLRGAFDLLKERSPAKYEEILPLYEESELAALVVEGIRLEDPSCFELVLEQELLDAIDNLTPQDLERLLKGEGLPRCKDFPIWPLCRRMS